MFPELAAFAKPGQFHPMKSTGIVLLSLLALASAEARVFESYEQCVARYGKPVSTVKTEIGSNVSFIKNNVSVTVEFRKDAAVGVTYYKLPDKSKPSENRAFTKDEVAKLLELNGGEHKWGAERKDMHGQPFWTTGDNALNSRLTNDRTILNIQDGAEFARKAKDTPPEAKPAPRDFDGF